jgi:hypothetical protein
LFAPFSNGRIKNKLEIDFSPFNHHHIANKPRQTHTHTHNVMEEIDLVISRSFSFAVNSLAIVRVRICGMEEIISTTTTTTTLL